MAKSRQQTKKKSTPPKSPPRIVGGVTIPKNLPVPSKGKNLTKPSKMRIAKLVCQIYSTDLYALEEVLKVFGINSYNTWKNWCGQIAEIAVLYKEAATEKESRYFHNLKERTRTSIERRVAGETRILRTVKIRKATPAEKKEMGQPEIEILMVREEIEREIYIPPSDQMLIYVSSNQDGNNFTKNPQPVAPEEKDVNVPPIDWVD